MNIQKESTQTAFTNTSPGKPLLSKPYFSVLAALPFAFFLALAPATISAQSEGNMSEKETKKLDKTNRLEDKKRLEHYKLIVKESEAKETEAERVLQQARHAKKEAKSAYKAEKQAQKARRAANKQARKLQALEQQR